ncbi:MAG: hypothetical protein OXE49_21155 [Gemmatimonadetes bacterium]|nr:hypothetical protein [Gemmatimonadota bacterium]
MRQTHVIGGDITGVGLVARDEQVQPAVVVVVPKPHWKLNVGWLTPARAVMSEKRQRPLASGPSLWKSRLGCPRREM